MATYVTYKSVIAQAIADFNAVQGALNTKDSTIASAADGSSGTSLVPTNELPSKIRDYLVFPKRTLKIDRYGIISVADPVVAGTNRTGYESVEVPQATTTVSGATVKIATAGWMDVGDAGTVATGKLYGLSGTVSTDSSTGANTYTVMGGVETSGYIAKTDPRPTHVIAGATFSGGAITVPTLKVGAISIAKTAEASQDSTVNLGSIGFADSMSDADKTAYPYYFKIDMTAAGTSGTVSRAAVSATAGYTSAKTVSAATTKAVSVSPNSKTGYVKLARATFELSGTNIIAKNTSANDSIGGSGYIKAGEIAFKLTKGTTAASVDTLTAPKVAIKTTKTGIETDTSSAYYITVTGDVTPGSVTAKATVTEGYQTATTKTATSPINPTVTGSDAKVYIKAGSVYHGAGFTISGTVHDTDDSLIGNPEGVTFPFTTSRPASGDYLEINATDAYTVRAGYQSEHSETAKSPTYFIPKAVLQYVENSTDGSNFIQVKTGGYLPAGVLGDIAGFDSSTTPDYAKIDAIKYSETPTFNSSNNTYTWTGSANVSSAGYLKENTKISGNLDIAKATFTSTPSVVTAPKLTFGAVNMGGITAGDGATNIISIPASTDAGKTRATVKTTAGYIGVETLTYDATVAATSGTKTISIANTNATSSATASILSHSARLGSGEAVSGNKQGWAVSVSSVPSYPYVMLTSNSTATITTSNLGLLSSSKASALATGASVGYGTFDGTNDKTKSYAYIAAAASPTVTGASATVSIGTVAVGTATQFDAVSGTKQANAKTASSGNKTASISGSTTSLNDKYVCGTVSVSGTATANATASINSDASGANVDSYVESLFKRMLGQAYTAVSGD